MSDPLAASGSGLFDGVLARGPVRQEVGDKAWLQAMLEVEAALARAEARAGLLTAEEAAAITQTCQAGRFDIGALGRAAAETGNPVASLVRTLVAALDGPAAGQIHRGATSQDVMDTAAMLVLHRALGAVLTDLDGAADAAAALAVKHRTTLMAGRTLLQHALPITFGLKAAGWLAALDEAATRLDEIRRRRLAVQLGGAVGTLASLGTAGVQVLGYLAEELSLATPVLPWHTNRTRLADAAGALGSAAGAIGKAARDITLLAQTEVAEVAEVREGGRIGVSSTLPHKRNPVAAVSAVACATRAPGLVSTILAAMVQEHERAAGVWQAEWRPICGLLTTVGSAAAWLRDSLEHLAVDVQRMRANLELTRGMLLSERVTAALSPALGRLRAHDLVSEACTAAIARGRPLSAELVSNQVIRTHLPSEELVALLDPSSYLGSTSAFIDRALAAHADRRRAAAG
jgi:3-carboxy-cis,cis-muconate cycloisomerase